jgi:hypothetical protein
MQSRKDLLHPSYSHFNTPPSNSVIAIKLTKDHKENRRFIISLLAEFQGIYFFSDDEEAKASGGIAMRERSRADIEFRQQPLSNIAAIND